jgi:hypothetical protein
MTLPPAVSWALTYLALAKHYNAADCARVVARRERVSRLRILTPSEITDLNDVVSFVALFTPPRQPARGTIYDLIRRLLEDEEFAPDPDLNYMAAVDIIMEYRHG